MNFRFLGLGVLTQSSDARPLVLNLLLQRFQSLLYNFIALCCLKSQLVFHLHKLALKSFLHMIVGAQEVLRLDSQQSKVILTNI